MVHRVVWVGVIGLICCSFSLRADDPPEDSPPAQRIHTVETGPFEASILLDGHVQSIGAAEIQIKPKEWPTFIVEWAIESGRSVKAGDELVRFERTEFQRELDALMLEVVSNNASLALAQIELKLLGKTTPLDLEAAERTAAVALEEWNDFVRQGEALERQTVDESLKMAQDSLDGSQEELNQLEKMYKADDLTEETEEIILKRARREVERAQFMVKTAKVQHERRLEQELPREKRIKETAKDREALHLEKTRESLPATLSQKKLEVEKLQHNQKSLELKLAQMQADEKLLTLTSPLDGIVVYGQAEFGHWTTTEAMRSSLRPGGSITPHQVIMTIIPDQGTTLWVDLPEKDLGTSQIGQKGEFYPTAYAGTAIPCQLKSISRVFAKDGIFSGEVDLEAEKDGPGFKPLITGMTGKVRLVQFSASEVIAVPSSAVFPDEENPNQHDVYVSVEGGEPRRQPVEVGHRSVTKTHIKSGLQTGDKILLEKPEETPLE